MDKKRYTVTISFYIWADNDIDAMEQCKEMESQAHRAHDNSAEGEFIHETPVGSIENSEVDNFKTK